jgi:hypothetical protein
MTSIATIQSPCHPTSAMKLVDRWLLLGSYGPAARLHMASVWITLSAFLVVDTGWLWYSRLSLASANLTASFGSFYSQPSLSILRAGSHLLAHETDRIGRALREYVRRVELFAVAALVFAPLAVAVIVFCGPAPAPRFRFRMPGSPRSTNGSASIGLPLWRSPTQRAGKLAVGESLSKHGCRTGGHHPVVLHFGAGQPSREFLALLCVTSIGIAIGMMILPAAGAYSYYHPPLASYENFGVGAGMWHYDLLMALRTGSTSVIDFSVPNSNCLVTFPSGHTILAIIMTYALRTSRYTLIPALLINGQCWCPRSRKAAITCST